MNDDLGNIGFLRFGSVGGGFCSDTSPVLKRAVTPEAKSDQKTRHAIANPDRDFPVMMTVSTGYLPCRPNPPAYFYRASDGKPTVNAPDRAHASLVTRGSSPSRLRRTAPAGSLPDGEGVCGNDIAANSTGT